MTPVREAVVRAVLVYEGHFAVEDLVQDLRSKKVHEASTATVYRMLPLLLEAEIIRPALLSSGDRQRYEGTFERKHHDHLLCVECGTVVEFEFEAFEILQRDLAERYGFKLVGHLHELLGRCPKCRGVPFP